MGGLWPHGRSRDPPILKGPWVFNGPGVCKLVAEYKWSGLRARCVHLRRCPFSSSFSWPLWRPLTLPFCISSDICIMAFAAAALAGFPKFPGFFSMLWPFLSGPTQVRVCVRLCVCARRSGQSIPCSSPIGCQRPSLLCF